MLIKDRVVVFLQRRNLLLALLCSVEELASVGRDLHLVKALALHLCHDLLRQVVHACDLLVGREAFIFFIRGALAHLLIQLIFRAVRMASIHTVIGVFVIARIPQVKILAILERLVAPGLFLETDHFVDVRLLHLLNIVEFAADLILTILRLRDEVAKDLFTEVCAISLFFLVHLCELLMQLGPFFIGAFVLRANCSRCKLILREWLRVANRAINVGICARTLQQSVPVLFVSDRNCILRQ